MCFFLKDVHHPSIRTVYCLFRWGNIWCQAYKNMIGNVCIPDTFVCANIGLLHLP